MVSQKNVKHTGGSNLVSHETDGRSGLVFFIISLVLHVLFFVILVFAQEFRLPKPMPPVIQIDLVSFAPEPVLQDAPPPVAEKIKSEGLAVKSKPVKKKKAKIAHKKPDISLKTKPKNLKKLIEKKKQEKKKPVKKKENPKKEEPKAEEKQTEPDKSSEKLAQEKDEQKIDEALRRLEAKLKEQGRGNPTVAESKLSGTGSRASTPIELYNVILGTIIEQNWVFNEMLAKMDQDLEVWVMIKILKSGEIRDIIYETKSGNRYLDDSAKKAIKKANPLPALPPGYPYYNLVLIFTPRGVK